MPEKTGARRLVMLFQDTCAAHSCGATSCGRTGCFLSQGQLFRPGHCLQGKAEGGWARLPWRRRKHTIDLKRWITAARNAEILIRYNIYELDRPDLESEMTSLTTLKHRSKNRNFLRVYQMLHLPAPWHVFPFPFVRFLEKSKRRPF